MDETHSDDFGREQGENFSRPPPISLPKGGGAIRGIGEKFAANPATGTGSVRVPIAVSPGRSGFGPQLSLAYDSGAGNGIFGLGWSLSLPAITRKTDKGLPRYRDNEDSDEFILSGAEDLVPVLVEDKTNPARWIQPPAESRRIGNKSYRVRRYRPRIEGLFARIERWTGIFDPADVFWRSISRANVTTWYGKTPESRIADPADPTRIFSWLICQSHDDKGNVIAYRYKAEDSAGITPAQTHERHRTETGRSANRYIKRIQYGNQHPFLPVPAEDRTVTPLPAEWFFEVVFDYGEHDPANPGPQGARAWPVRSDPFSTYRAGFEMRTYRLCRRALMFHHFPDEPGVGAGCLVRSTDFYYGHEQSTADGHTPVHAVLTSVTQCGYRRQSGGYLKKEMPPVEFEYSPVVLDTQIKTLKGQSAESLPYGVDGAAYRWVDLDGEGLSGIFTEQGGAWFYKRNESPLTRRVDSDGPRYEARLGPAQMVGAVPAGGMGAARQRQFLDLAGDGRLDLVELARPLAGFYERRGQAAGGREPGWETFRAFRAQPNIPWDDPNLRFIDLTGDGHADVLISEDGVFTWYPSLAETGFGEFERVHIPTDEQSGPRIVFADRTEALFQADFSGDGLSDIVRIRNGEICYWPNLGYGRFGAKVAMDNAPWIDAADQFDPDRIRLADIDGSGMTDIIYPGINETRIWFNQSGNSWSAVHVLEGFPPVDNIAAVTATDLLGNGTACLVWSTPAAGDAQSPMRYIELMARGKPHLMIGVRNNLGVETRVRYAPSTYFYLQDKAAGRPWITRLPFPVHVVERVEIYDHISKNRFVTRYAYHHGYFDGAEREFRGFGMVEQYDTEQFAALNADGRFPSGDNIDRQSHIPPVLTRTWFHTGVYHGRERISDFFTAGPEAHDRIGYYREPGVTDAQAKALLLDDTMLPVGLTDAEQREACRALKGSMLRREVYGLDGTDKSSHPYTVTEQNFALRTVQPMAHGRHAVFFTHPNETITYNYERDPTDPQISHAITLQVDDFGSVLKKTAIGYGRRRPDMRLSAQYQSIQGRTLVTYAENRFTNAIDTANDHRTPLPCETRTYELTGYAPSGGAVRFRRADFIKDTTGGPQLIFDSELDYEQAPANGRQRRPIEHVRMLYRPNDLGASLDDPDALLPLGRLESLALPGENYKLAFTPGLLSQVFRRTLDGKPPENLLPVPADVLAADLAGGQIADRGGYADLDGNGHWWIPSGRAFHSKQTDDSAAGELAHARRHFYLPLRFRGPFGQWSHVRFDRYDLMALKTRDALGNEVATDNDYRVLQPAMVIDANRNRSAVAFDVLGMVVATAVMGKTGESLGDTLEGFDADLKEAVALEHLGDPLTDPHGILNGATSRMVYDLFAYRRSKDQPAPQPAVVYTLARETHAADLYSGRQTKIRHSFSYSDGFGREIQRKIQAESGPVSGNEPDEALEAAGGGLLETAPGNTAGRWVGSGWTVFNNKGQPVRRYEPFFTATHRFEFNVRMGVSPVVFYDPVGRAVGTLNPDHTWEKTVFDPWRRETWDANDTVLEDDPVADRDIADYFRRLPEAEYLPTWHARRRDGAMGAEEQAAAAKVAVHAGTPTVVYFDSLGRTFVTRAHNRSMHPIASTSDATSDEYLYSSTVLDIENNAREVIDARGRIVMRYDYDLLGNRIHLASMEAGERWMLSDVLGNTIRSWDSRGHRFRNTYDPLRRPVESFLTGAGRPELLLQRIVYGEDKPNPEARNQRGQVVELYDQVGIVTSDGYDFKGNLGSSSRRLAGEYKTALDWSRHVSLEPRTFSVHTRYDALNRPIEVTTPDRSVVRPAYNEANLLEKVDVELRGASAATQMVSHIDYNARGQRMQIRYGNGVETTYAYDPLTFRLIHLISRRLADTSVGGGLQPPANRTDRRVQNLRYTYDPVGNLTHIRDDAQQTVFFRNQRVAPGNEYAYDALYRLIEATGREHLGQGAPVPHAPDDTQLEGVIHPGDGDAMGRYVEQYLYDPAGNIISMQHRSSNPAHPGWIRNFDYREPSQLEEGKTNNRLSATTLGGTTEAYSYQGPPAVHGHMTAMPHLPLMRWDHRDQLRATARQVVQGGGTPETTWYAYDRNGRRMRKVTEGQAAAGRRPARRKERIYLGGFEIYREYGPDGSEVTLERETLHLMDDQQRIALIETRTQGEDRSPAQLVRFQLSNHQGSASLELDRQARIISYEEYAPHGSTSYQAVRNQTDTPKRYRYSGKERDEENRFYYHGARYYPPWLGRWISPDPAGMVDGANLYVYVRNNPVMNTDSSGTQCDPESQTCIDPTTPTAREEALQQSLPEDERYLPPPEPPAAPAQRPVHTVPPAGPQWELGPRGEHIPTRAWRGGPLRDISAYDKPFAVTYAQQGNYEAAELAQNYLCATCHILTKVPPDEFNLGGYVRGWQRDYIRGLVEVPLKANPIGGAWEIGVSGGQFLTGESSGLHISNISSVIVDDYWDAGRTLSTKERLWEGGTFVVGAALMGYGAYSSRVPTAGPGGTVPPQGGWQAVRLSQATPEELALWDDVLTADRVAIGRTNAGAGHLHAALQAEGRGALILDDWLQARGIAWTQRWQDVFNRALFDRGALMAQPTHVMGGGAYTLGEATAAEAGAQASGTFNIPFWPGQ